MKSKGRILLVEEATVPAVGLRIALEHEGYEVVHAEDGRAALELAARQPPDLVLTDLALPVMDGFALIEHLRNTGSTVPVIAVSDSVAESTRIAALRLRADFLPRPFGLHELLLLLESRLRGTGSAPGTSAHTVAIGQAVINLQARVISRDNVGEPLRPKEFHVLSLLLRAGGAVVAKEDLLRDVWGFNCEIESRRVDFQVAALRRKIEKDPARPQHLLTVRGVGYRLLQ